MAERFGPASGRQAPYFARRLIACFGLHRKSGGRPDTLVDGSDPALHQYLRARIGGGSDERLHVVWTDSGRGYLCDETFASGSHGRIAARLRPLMERALSLGAGGFLLAHNHPSGDCRPSADDISATRRIADLAAALELDLVDHLVVTRTRIFSMRGGGCL